VPPATDKPFWTEPREVVADKGDEIFSPLSEANYGVCLSILVKAKCALCDCSAAGYADAGREPCEIRAACVYACTALCTVVRGAFQIFCSLTSVMRRAPATAGPHMGTRCRQSRRSLHSLDDLDPSQRAAWAAQHLDRVDAAHEVSRRLPRCVCKCRQRVRGGRLIGRRSGAGWKRGTRLRRNTRRWGIPGVGSGCFHRLRCRSTRAVGWIGGTS
jgi:hypothetical protein